MRKEEEEEEGERERENRLLKFGCTRKGKEKVKKGKRFESGKNLLLLLLCNVYVCATCTISSFNQISNFNTQKSKPKLNSISQI